MKHEKEQLKNKRVNLETIFYVAVAIVTLVIATFQAGVWYARSQAISNPGTTYGPGDVDAYSYIVFKEGSTYYAKNGSTRAIDYSGTDATSVIQTVENVVDDTGGIIYLKGVQLPSAVVLSSNVFIIEEYQGKTTYYNGLTAQGIMEPYFTDKAFYPTSVYPLAISYENKTYVVYQAGKTQDPMITYWDENKQVWATPVQVGVNPLTDDSHGSPALIIDNNGYIHVFWGSHSGAGAAKHSKSTNPKDITSWTAKPDMPPGASATYPKLVKDSNGYLYYFYRYTVGATQSTIGYVKSTDGGETWSAENTIVNIGNNYGQYVGNAELYDTTEDRIYLTWSVYAYANSTRINVYCAYLNTVTGIMYSVGGTNLGTTIDLTELNTVRAYNSAGGEVTIPTVHVTSTGTPYIIFGDLTAAYWKFAKWTGASWTVSNVFASKLYSNQQGDFIINDSNNIEAYLQIIRDDTLTPDRSAATVMKITSSNGGASWSATEIIYTLEDMYLTVEIFVPLNNDANFKILFVPEYLFYQILSSENFDVNYKYYAWGDKGFVYRVWKW